MNMTVKDLKAIVNLLADDLPLVNFRNNDGFTFLSEDTLENNLYIENLALYPDGHLEDFDDMAEETAGVKSLKVLVIG